MHIRLRFATSESDRDLSVIETIKTAQGRPSHSVLKKIHLEPVSFFAVHPGRNIRQVKSPRCSPARAVFICLDYSADIIRQV